MAAATLLKTARSLDQSSSETTASKLERLWGALAAASAGASGGFYASEEVALRWILKNTSAGPEAETIRRWPLTWHILACLFRRIPLFTLAKTLAERRFIAILQQTARDLDTRHPPKKGSSPADDEDENPRKRKKWQAAQFDLDALRGPQQRLISAAALFSALRVLLGRLEEAKITATASASATVTTAGGLGVLHSSHDRIGVEQIKSFFCTSAADAMTLLVPLLRVCRLALTTDMGDIGDGDGDGDDNERGRTAAAGADAEASQPLEGQATWIATFSAIWDLRLQSPADPPEVAINMTLEGCGMLRCLLDIPGDMSPKQTAAGAEVRQRWAAGLQRFLTNNVVLPARSAYLNYKDLKTLEIARDSLAGHESLSLVLFYLALKAPRMIAIGGGGGGGGGGGAAAATSRDNERWLQAAFDAIQEPLHTSATTSAEERNRILTSLLDMAARYDASPSRESLQDVCRSCALAGEQPTTIKSKKKAMKKAERAIAEAKQIAVTDWRLAASVARCDADAFLVSAAGEKLLDDLVQNLASAPPAPSDCPYASAFLVSLAEGSAKARSLPAFIARWRAGICQGGGSSQSVWLGKDIRKAVAGALQTSLTKTQLLELLDQADQASEKKKKDEDADDTTDATTSAAVCKLVVFDAISAGIRLEEFEDAAGSKMADAVAGVDLPSELAPEILAIRWRLVRRTLGWLDSVTAEGIWMAVQASLKRVARRRAGKGGKAGLNELTFEALACAFAFWMALKRSGAAEQEARDTTWALFGQFQGELAGLTNDADKAELMQELTRRVAAYDETADQFGGSFESRAATLATYLAWMFCGSSRFIDEMTRSSKEPATVINALSPWQSGFAGTQASSALVSLSLAGFQNEKAAAIMTEKHIEHLEEAGSSRGQQWHDAAGGLLRTPAYVLTRRLRERIVSALLPQEKPASGQAHLTLGEAVVLLDLLIRVVRERIVDDMDLDRLIWLGSVVEATARSATLQSALGLLDRYRYVATSALKHSLADSESRDGRRREAVLARISSWDGGESAASGAPSVVLQLVLLQAALLAVESIPASRLGSAHVVVPAQERLAALIVGQLRQSLEGMEDTEMTGAEDAGSPANGRVTLPLLFAFDAAMATGRQQDKQDTQAQLLQHLGTSTAQKMKTTADRLCRQKHKIGWKWKALIAWHLRSEDEPRREVRFQGLFADGAEDDDDDVALTAASVLVDSDLLRDYLEGETRGYSRESLLSYIEELTAALDNEPTPIGQLLAIQYLLGRLFEMPGAATAQTDGGFDLGAVHNRLAQRLPRAVTVTEARLLAQTLRTLLLDDKAAAAAMKQWNIDSTLSAVALAVALDGDEDKDSSNVRASPANYEGACGLVEAVLKRHRLRLEGRFHLVVATLQALLSRLVVAGQQESLCAGGAARAAARTESSPENWIGLAKRFSRLLELVCEPSTAAVATMARRGAGSGAAAAAPPMLHSATDAAKRSAGQHMYLVLMAYIKLQIDGAVVTRGVREALEPGLFSIIGITSDETRRLLNDAVDAGGRALFRDLYRRWLQFGKWKGV